MLIPNIISNLISRRTKFSGYLDLQVAIASLHYVFLNSLKHEVKTIALMKELEFLGFPKEHLDITGQLFRKERHILRLKLICDTLNLNSFVGIHWILYYPLNIQTYASLLCVQSRTNHGDILFLVSYNRILYFLINLKLARIAMGS